MKPWRIRLIIGTTKIFWHVELRGCGRRSRCLRCTKKSPTVKVISTRSPTCRKSRQHFHHKPIGSHFLVFSGPNDNESKLTILSAINLIKCNLFCNSEYHFVRLRLHTNTEWKRQTKKKSQRKSIDDVEKQPIQRPIDILSGSISIFNRRMLFGRQIITGSKIIENFNYIIYQGNADYRRWQHCALYTSQSASQRASQPMSYCRTTDEAFSWNNN